MREEMEQLYLLLNQTLYYRCPILSGNMSRGIKITKIEENRIELEIEAKYYDLNKWNKEHKVVYTGKTVLGTTDYAMFVNEFGAFGKHNSSEHWVNRVVNDVCHAITKNVDCKIPLS